MRTGHIITAAAVAFSAAAQPTSMEFVTIGDPGNIGYNNINDFGFPTAFEGRGSVDYRYRITTQEVSTREWLEFFNLFVAQDPAFERILDPNRWGADPIFPGSTTNRVHELQSFSFAADIPIAVSFRQATMYLNWLHNGQTSDPASLESGVYDVSTFTENPDGTRNDQIEPSPGARFRLPTVDEFLKAGFYDPDKNGEGPGWWEYGHSSDELPVPGLPGEGGETISGVPESVREAAFEGISATEFPLNQYPDVTSPWGLLDINGGNREVLADLSDVAAFADLRWRFFWQARNSNAPPSDSDYRADLGLQGSAMPASGLYSFRIVTAIPSPGVGSVLAFGALTPGLLWRRRRA
ncbi:MAG: hypothetical protein AAGF47_05185 [Planctomycetota bacterium]